MKGSENTTSLAFFNCITYCVSRSLGIPEQEFSKESEMAPEDRQFRLEAIHVRGIEAMIAEDIYEYFKEFNPVSFERVNSDSANIVWAMASSSAKAMITLSKPLSKRVVEANDDEDMEGGVDVSGGEKPERKPLTSQELTAKVRKNHF